MQNAKADVVIEEKRKKRRLNIYEKNNNFDFDLYVNVNV